MSRLRGIALALLLACAAACDGGTSGTGITTAQGNIVSISSVASGMAPSASAAASASAGLAGIRVSVEGTSASDDTDASGAFTVKGSFEGHLTLLFQRSADGIDARLPMNLPSRGTLTFNDVAIDTTMGVAKPAERLLDFEGIVQSVDCGVGVIAFVSDVGDTDAYLVDVAGSTLETQSGAAVSCAAVQVGQSAAISGTVEDDGSIGSAVVRFGG